MSFALRLLLAVTAATLVVSACSDDNPTETATVDQTSTSSSETTATTDQTSTSSSETTATTDQASTTAVETTESSASETTTSTSAEEATCSAAGTERPGPQPDLPAAVAERREAILTEALECDIDGLAALTGPSFTASFGGGEPAEVWTAAEEQFNSEPMRALVEILRLPATTGDDGKGGVAYIWPPAFTYETWEQVPEADREALRVIYDDDDFESFAQFGGYIGYRASITEDGTWTVFVAGD